MYGMGQVHIATSVCLSVCLSFCGQVPQIDRHANVDLLPYSKLYVQTRPGIYSYVRVSVSLSRHVLEIDREASIDLLPYSKLYVQTKSGKYSHVRVSVCLTVLLWTSSGLSVCL